MTGFQRQARTRPRPLASERGAGARRTPGPTHTSRGEHLRDELRKEGYEGGRRLLSVGEAGAKTGYSLERLAEGLRRAMGGRGPADPGAGGKGGPSPIDLAGGLLAALGGCSYDQIDGFLGKHPRLWSLLVLKEPVRSRHPAAHIRVGLVLSARLRGGLNRSVRRWVQGGGGRHLASLYGEDPRFLTGVLVRNRDAVLDLVLRHAPEAFAQLLVKGTLSGEEAAGLVAGLGEVSDYQVPLKRVRDRAGKKLSAGLRRAIEAALAKTGAGVSEYRSRQRAALRKHGPASAKKVSSTAMVRLAKAQKAIDYVKGVVKLGAGNQKKDVEASGYQSYLRTEVVRSGRAWKMTPSVRELAQRSPNALRAAKSELLEAGNCFEQSSVAFAHLRLRAKGERINTCAVKGGDHAFLIIGNLSSDKDADLAVADPWPTRPMATAWMDHFCYRADRKKIDVMAQMTADGANAKDVIKAGLELTSYGRKMLHKKVDAGVRKEVARITRDRTYAASRGKRHLYEKTGG